MTRYLLLMVALCCYSFGVQAQVSLPYTQDFESGLSSDFTITTNVESDTALDMGSNCAGNNSLLFTGNSATGFTGGSTSATPTNAWVDNTTHHSQADLLVDATGVTNSLVLNFDLKQEYSYGPNYSWFRVLVNGVPVSPDFNPTTANSDPCVTQTVNLTAYIGTTFTLSFQASMKYNDANGSGGQGDNAFLDNISIAEVSCLAPSSIMVSNVANTTADISWTAGNASQTDWEVSIVPMGSPAMGGTSSGTLTTYNATGLSSNTTYDVYVREICSAGDTTSWVGPMVFTTLCDPYTIPYFEGFESGFTDQDPLAGCLSQESTTGTNVWTANSTLTNYNRTPRTGSFNAYLRYGNEDWLFIPIQLTGGVSYTSDVFARQDGTTTTNSDITIAYGTTNTAAGMTNTIVGPTGIDNNYQLIRGLFTPATTGVYYVGIKGFMNSSPWYISIDDIAIYESPNCVNPNMPMVANVTDVSADLSWTDNNSTTPPEWEIEYGPAPLIPGTGTRVVVTTNPYTLTGLTSLTSYDFYVRSICAPGDTSTWSPAGMFRTQLATLSCGAGSPSVIYTEDFEGGFPSGWNQVATGDPDWTWDGVTGTPSSNTGPSAAHSGSGFMFLETSGGSVGQADTLTSSTINLTTVTAPARLLFHYHMYGDAMGTLSVEVSDDGGASWNPEWTVTGQQQMADTDPWAIAAIDLAAYTGSSILVRFIGTKGAGNPVHAGDMAIDLVQVETCVSCSLPSSLMAANVTATSADLSWTDNNSTTPAEWEIEYGVAPLTPGTGTRVVVTTNPYTLTGLTDLTNYDFYVRSICGPGDTSLWSTVGMFSTPIMALSCATGNPSMIYTEDFEGAFPASWNQVATADPDWTWDGAGGTSSSNTGPSAAHSGSGYIYLETSSGSVGEADTLTSSTINLTTVTAPARLLFHYHMYGDAMGTLSVEISDDGGASWNPEWSLTGQQQMADTDPWSIAAIDLAAYTGSSILVRFIGTKGAGNPVHAGDMAIDLVQVETCVSCALPSNLMSSNVYGTSADLDWTENGTAMSWEIEYGPSPLTPGTGTRVVTGSKPYTLTGLTTTTGYDFYVRAICGAGDSSLWVGPSSFTTTVSCPAPSALSATNITTTTAELNWTENALATDWIIEYGPAPLTPGTGTMIQVNSKPHTLTGLTSGSAYEFYVYSYCGAGDSSAVVGPLLFSTNCLPFTATYTQNFDGAPAVDPFDGIPCWRATGPGADDVELSSSTDDGAAIPSGPNVVELNDGTLSSGDSAILVSPNFSDLGTGLNRIRFMAHQEASGGGDLYIGLMGDPRDAATFVPYDTITSAELNATPGFEEYIIDFDDVATIGANRHIAFMHGSNAFELYVDDFVYEPMPIPGDVEVTEVFTMMTDYCGADSVDVGIYFTNNTGNIETNIPFTGSVNGFTTSGIFPYLGPNESDTLIVRIPTPASSGYDLVAWTELGSDFDMSNDTSAMITIYVSHLSANALVLSNYNGVNVSCNGAADGEATALPGSAGSVGTVSYMWLGNGATTNTVIGLSAGTATVVITDSIGCSDSAMVTLTEPSAVSATATDDGTGSSATASGTGGTVAAGYTFMWDAAAGNQTTATATGLMAGSNYCVTITDDNGCTSLACVTIVVTGLDDVSNSNAFKVYPNPTTGKVFVELGLDTPTDVQLTMLNAIGENVMTKQLNGQDTRIELNTGELPTGVYLMRFEMENTISTQKLIIQRP